MFDEKAKARREQMRDYLFNEKPIGYATLREWAKELFLSEGELLKQVEGAKVSAAVRQMDAQQMRKFLASRKRG